jgi:hypothetical protein
MKSIGPSQEAAKILKFTPDSSFCVNLSGGQLPKLIHRASISLLCVRIRSHLGTDRIG